LTQNYSFFDCSLKHPTLYFFLQLKFKSPIDENHMPVLPQNTDSNTWLICFSHKVDGNTRFIKETFVGSIREAMFREMQLRGLARDGIDSIFKQT